METCCTERASTLVLLCLLISMASRIESVEASEPTSSGLNQLVVINPETHERGLPAVLFEGSDNDGLQVDIPRTLHVHRFYYDGDREYQGPILTGGPTTLVANHPRSGQRVYVNVTLPQGAPIIAYSRKAISYIYDDRRVRIAFARKDQNGAIVSYHSGQGLGRVVSSAVQDSLTKSKSFFASSATAQSLADGTKDGKRSFNGLVSAVDSAASKILDGAKTLVQKLPGVAPLSSMGEGSAQASYESRLRGLTRKNESSKVQDILTNR